MSEPTVNGTDLGTYPTAPEPGRRGMVARRRRVLVTLLSATVLLASGLAGASEVRDAPAASATPTAAAAARPTPRMAIDNSSRASVAAAYKQWLKPTLDVPIGWTGSVSGCNAGTVSAAAQQATLDAVNFHREMANVDPAKFDANYSAMAQQAALIMHANQALSHTPPADWLCWSTVGSTAAGESNLYLGRYGASAIVGYVIDPGGNNVDVGHRRWVISPFVTTMGSGSTFDGWTGANALHVIGQADPDAYSPSVIAWPTAGYFPAQLEPSGRWSLSIPYRPGDFDGWSADPFATAQVTVRETTGAAHSATVISRTSGYGYQHTLTWQVGGIGSVMGGSDKSFRVTVTGVKHPSVPDPYTYYVTLFDADAPTPYVTGYVGWIKAEGRRVRFFGGAKGVGRDPDVTISRNGQTLATIRATRPGTNGFKGWLYERDDVPGTHEYCANFPNPTVKGGWTKACEQIVVK